MNKKKYNLIFNCLSFTFVILSFVLNMIEVTVSGTTSNPTENFQYSFAYGLFRFPGFISWEGVKITFNFWQILIFQVIYTIGVCIWIFKWKISQLLKRRNEYLNIIIIALMLIGIFGFTLSADATTILSAILPTEIETSFKISHLLSGLVFAFLAILIIIIEFLASKWTKIEKFFNK